MFCSPFWQLFHDVADSRVLPDIRASSDLNLFSTQLAVNALASLTSRLTVSIYSHSFAPENTAFSGIHQCCHPSRSTSPDTHTHVVMMPFIPQQSQRLFMRALEYFADTGYKFLSGYFESWPGRFSSPSSASFRARISHVSESHHKYLL